MKKKIDLSTLEGLELTANGLLPREVIEQKKKFGLNAILETQANLWIELLKETLKDPMLWLLIGAGSLFAFVGETSDSIILFLALIPLFFMDAYLHFKAQSSAQTLRNQLQPTSRVLRGGRELEIESQDIVPGDIILLKSGDSLPADGIFFTTLQLQIDESVLTGEAFPVSKSAWRDIGRDLRSDVAIDSQSLGYAGTRVLTGTAQLRIYATSANTMYGEIIRSVSNIAHERTPLQQSIDRLMRYLVAATLALCALLAIVRYSQGNGWVDALLSAATLAVAAIPEEFPIVFSFFLGVGVFRLAKKNALVRRAVTVENIGRTTKICTDKTGTITVGELSLTHFDLAPQASEESILKIALLASNQNGTDPVDIAIASKSEKLKVIEPLHIKEFPFTEDRKRQATFSKTVSGEIFCALKGAPETIVSRSNLSSAGKAEWLNKASQWARQGHKVLACASKILTAEEIEKDLEPDHEFDFEGLIAFEDPPRPEVKSAIAYCQKSHIGVLMLTGDHPETAAAIARDIGLGTSKAFVVSAEESPERFSQEALLKHPDYLRSLQVVARCTPLQKLWIVQSLKAAGEIVAVTGDGVNDVPALKAADIGIAMGLRGSNSAKEVSSIILTDDNFESLVAAIREGRQLFANLKVSFLYLLLFHIPLVCTAAFIPLFGFPLLYLPIHTVWLELIVHPTSLFAFQNKTQMNLEAQSNAFFTKSEIVRIALIGGSFCFFVAGIYIYSLRETGVEQARGSALALLSLWSLTIVIKLSGLSTQGSKVIALGTAALTICLIQFRLFSSVLHVAPLHVSDWVTIFCILILFSFFIQKPKSTEPKL